MMHLNPIGASLAAAVLISAVNQDQLPGKDGNIQFIDDIWNTAPVKVAAADRSSVKSTASRTERSKDVRSAKTGLSG